MFFDDTLSQSPIQTHRQAGIDERSDSLSVPFNAAHSHDRGRENIYPISTVVHPAGILPLHNSSVYPPSAASTPFPHPMYCDPLCGCACHHKLCLRLPHAAAAYTGPLVISLERACSTPRCARQRASTLTFLGGLPPWLIPLSVCLQVTTSPFGVRIAACRVRADHREFIRALRGGVVGLTALFDERRASVHDVDRYGQNCLHVCPTLVFANQRIATDAITDCTLLHAQSCM